MRPMPSVPSSPVASIQSRLQSKSHLLAASTTKHVDSPPSPQPLSASHSLLICQQLLLLDPLLDPPVAVPSHWCLGTPGPLVPPDGVPSLLVQPIAGSAGSARLSSGSTGVACVDRSTTAARSSSVSAGVACRVHDCGPIQLRVRMCGGSTTAARPMVALENLDIEGILLDCFEDNRLVLGLFAAGSGVLLLETSSSYVNVHT